MSKEIISKHPTLPISFTAERDEYFNFDIELMGTLFYVGNDRYFSPSKKDFPFMEKVSEVEKSKRPHLLTCAASIETNTAWGNVDGVWVIERDTLQKEFDQYRDAIAVDSVDEYWQQICKSQSNVLSQYFTGDVWIIQVEIDGDVIESVGGFYGMPDASEFIGHFGPLDGYVTEYKQRLKEQITDAAEKLAAC